MCNLYYPRAVKKTQKEG